MRCSFVDTSSFDFLGNQAINGELIPPSKAKDLKERNGEFDKNDQFLPCDSKEPEVITDCP